MHGHAGWGFTVGIVGDVVAGAIAFLAYFGHLNYSEIAPALSCMWFAAQFIYLGIKGLVRLFKWLFTVNSK